MKKRILLISIILVIAVGAVAVLSQNVKEFKALLSGFEEVPAVSTDANGEFRARISNDESSISYELNYSDLQGNITQAHIHFAQAGVNGGVAVWLCSNLASPPTPVGVQPCAASPGSVSGMITAGDVVGPGGQGISAGEFDELLRAIRAGKTYVNVHTSAFPGGEIRGQIDPGKGGKN